ncbi:MAG: hypothetical protein COW63_17145 [Bacteroidetes bacterium CG18_big_fil_WC_8_21_14_2_50_41_14]|nr:MAG: hypothetical protein COW63_17145 [Bacteroidetes bacterium CG18_big_fil_WC_8_21_14_2_50_41_14]PJB59462.1 MAG: hypothetical protein CO098_03285 [Bacteroidetes bacterium CG_4_9_14_3_um_filter_41_19]
MKTTIISLICFITFQSGIAQNENAKQVTIDTLRIVKEKNYYQDTLWVMDSSQTYYSLDWELYLSGNYKVETRDDQGNKLTAIKRIKDRYSELFENYSFDSVTYFGGSDKVKSLKTYGWNVLDSKWMDNVFQLYDENQQWLDSYDKSWNRSQFEYGTGHRTTNEYENEALVLSVKSTLSPRSEVWEPNERTIHILNESGMDSISLHQNWNMDTEQWDNYYKYESHYIDSLNTIDYYGYIWDSTASYWLPVNFTHQVSSENGLRDTTEVYKWDSIGNYWKMSFKSIALFNESNQILEIVNMFYDNEDTLWVNNKKMIYSYEVDLQNSIQYKWDTLSDYWKPEYKSYRSYAFENIPDTTQYDQWDTIGQSWVPIFRSISVFDDRQNQIEDLFQLWTSITPESLKDWKTNSRTIFFWSPFNPESVIDTKLTNMKVYPNPAREYIIFESFGQQPTNLFIYNSSGEQVGHLYINSSPLVWNTTGLAPGMYFYHGEQGDKIVSGKIVLVGE